MAKRHLRVKRKVAPKKQTVEEPKRIVLVGTYAARQLEKWPGYYNYPLYGRDKIDVGAVKGVNELWLFSGAKLPRYFAAECLGVKTREELKEYGYKATGKGHGSGKYLLFKIKKLYAPSRDFAESVTIRTKDFAGQGATQKQLKEYLESPDRKDPLLAKMLPKIITELPREMLRVCEAAVQLPAWSPVVGMSPVQEKIASIVMCVSAFGRERGMSASDAYCYLNKYSGVAFLDEHYSMSRCYSEEMMDECLSKVCRNHGGTLK